MKEKEINNWPGLHFIEFIPMTLNIIILCEAKAKRTVWVQFSLSQSKTTDLTHS